MAKVKITVIKKAVHRDLLDEYLDPAVRARGYDVCSAFEEGKEFIFDGMKYPEGFCHWARADIQRDVMMVLFGQGYPWVKQPETAITCCTDGFRPVTFKLERIEAE
jgi:uncharacterized repeat protein (TIGR04076 family)